MMDVPEQRRWVVPKYLDPRLTPQERSRYYEPGGLGSMTASGYWNTRARGMGGTRGPSSASDPTPSAVSVFMNGTLLGKADYLREMRLLDASEVRYWDAGSASARLAWVIRAG